MHVANGTRPGLPARRLAAALAALLMLVLGLALADEPPAPRADGRTAWVLTIDGPIGPATASYVIRGLEKARAANAGAVVLEIDTPGGLDTSMREMIRAILASPVPVLSWVGPSGARAASAGTFLLYASPIAAMAPGTNLGAATPVQIGGGMPMPGQPDAQRPEERDGGEASGTAPRAATEAKALNDAIAYIRSLAELHGRDVEFAEAAVREAASLAADDALAKGVIDLVVASIEELLEQAHGREVRLGDRRVTLDTRGLPVERHAPDWRARLLGAITNPNVALILMLIGVYGLLFEFMNPGSLVPGTIGAISLLLGLYALSVLPVDHVGIALLVLGLALIVAEAFSPSFGILGIGGVVAFAAGAMLLFDTDVPGFGVSLPFVAGLGLAFLGAVLLVARLFAKSRRARVVTGPAALVGQEAEVVEWHGDRGRVHVAGERWHARGPTGLSPGQTVRVRALHGLDLIVEAPDPRPTASTLPT
jgi:membrane-bound serine protease (ClpP class)